MTNDTATNVAKWATSTFLTTIGIAALSVAIAVAPAEAKKQPKPPGEAPITDLDSGDPLFLVVSTGSQKVDIYRGTQLVVTSQVSTGMPAHPTFLGAFSILEKQRWHHSNIYSGAPMPWMNRITWSGTALHAGIVPGYPASHGCIRLPYSFAPKLYDITSVGDNVVISRDRPAPALIEHPNLFQPVTPPSPAMVKQEQTKQKQSSNDLLILPLDAELPHMVRLAKAEVGVTTDVPSEDLGTDDTGHATTLPKTPVGAQNPPAAPAPAASTAAASEAKPAGVPAPTVGAVEDTRTHAFDPLVGGPDSNGNHAVGAAASAHALDSDNEDGPAPVAAAPAVMAPAPVASAPEAKVPAPVAAAPSAETPAPAAFVMSATTTDTPKPTAEKAPVTTPVALPVAAPSPEVAAAPVAAPAVPAAPAPVVAATAAGIAPAAALVASLAPAPVPAKPVPAAPVIAAGIAPAAIVAASVAPAPAPVPAPEVATVIPVAATPAAVAAAAPAEAAAQSPAPAEAAPVLVATATIADDNSSPSPAEKTLDAGTKAAALQAAEPRSTAPLRILVTRRTQRDRIVGVQNILADLGYLDRVDFDGTLGKATVTAIKAFQKANSLPESGAFTDALVDKVYAVAGKGQPPLGHIFVRQEFGRVFDAPVGLKNPEEPLGTHVYTALNFAPGDTKTRWMAVTVQGGPAEDALDRIEIPDDIRQRISERLTPGSTLIIGDTSINAAGLPKGGDFVVLAKYSSPKTAANPSASDDGTVQPKKKRTVRRNTYNYSYGYNTQRNYQPQQRTFRSYPGWPW